MIKGVEFRDYAQALLGVPQIASPEADDLIGREGSGLIETSGR